MTCPPPTGGNAPVPPPLSRETRRALLQARLRAENRRRQRMLAAVMRFSATHGTDLRHRK